MLNHKINTVAVDPFFNQMIKKHRFYRFAMLLILAVGSAGSTTTYAYQDNYNNYSSTAYNTSTVSAVNQPKIRWYRYYNANGQPNLSSTITDQHLRYGYEGLDRNMQVVKQVSPYSPEQYAKQKAQRDVLAAQHESDMALRRNYGSAAQAASKRDQILADMTSRKGYLQTQLVTLQSSLSENITRAASFERQKKPIPASLQTSLKENHKNVDEAQRNIQSIELRQQQIKAEYAQIISRLNRLNQ